MKKLLTIFTIICLFFCLVTKTYALEDEQRLLVTKVEQMIGQKNVEIIIYESVDEYVDAIMNDENLTCDDKDDMIAEAWEESRIRGFNEKYMNLRFDVKVTDSYHCYPYFYVKWRFADGEVSPYDMIEVKNANIDRVHNGMTKQFTGTLYYNLESGRRLYWDLNGDFYNNGTTTYTGGVKINVTEDVTMNFSISYSSNFYAGVSKQHTYTF